MRDVQRPATEEAGDVLYQLVKGYRRIKVVRRQSISDLGRRDRRGNRQIADRPIEVDNLVCQTLQERIHRGRHHRGSCGPLLYLSSDWAYG